jgi:hypothetical protein
MVRTHLRKGMLRVRLCAAAESVLQLKELRQGIDIPVPCNPQPCINGLHRMVSRWRRDQRSLLGALDGPSRSPQHVEDSSDSLL